MKPNRYYVYSGVANQYNQGLRRDFDIVDRTATLAGEICAAGLMAGLTDPDRDWAQFGPGIPGFELDQAGQQWYEDIRERYQYVLMHCNFYEMQAQHYDDVVFFGTSPIIDYADEETIINCRVPCSGEYLVGTGFDFSDEVLYEEYRLTVSQIVEGFGIENCPNDVQKLWRQKGGALENEFVIRHAIEPNFAIDDGAGHAYGVVGGDRDFTWREMFWLAGKKDIKPLSLAGFKEQPFAVSRWNVQGAEAYGRCVGENMLVDTIQLQFMTRQMATAVQKVNDPPMGADVSLMNQPTATNPGGITWMNTGAGGEKKFFPLYQINPRIDYYVQGIAAIAERLRETAFVPAMQPLLNLREETKGQVTATEVDKTVEERLLPLGPVFGRIYSSLRQRVRRHIAIMGRRGLIPPKPPSLRGVPTRIEFVSMLTAAQKATRTAAIARSSQFLGTLAGTWPEAKMLLDVEAAGREFNEGVGAPAGIIRSPQAFKREVAVAAKAAQQQTALAQTAQGAQAAAALGKTSLAPGSALSALVPGQGGQ